MPKFLIATVFLFTTLISGCGYQVCAQAGACNQQAGEQALVNLQTSADNPAADIHQALRSRLMLQGRLGGAGAKAIHIDAESLQRAVVARDAKSQPLQFEWIARVTATAGEQQQTFEARRRFLANGDNLLAEEALAKEIRQQAINALVTQLQRYAAQAASQ